MKLLGIQWGARVAKMKVGATRKGTDGADFSIGGGGGNRRGVRNASFLRFRADFKAIEIS